MSEAKAKISLSRKRCIRNRQKKQRLVFDRNIKKNTINSEVKASIKSFYLRDGNSRLTADKKTQLHDSSQETEMKKLHSRYLFENKNWAASYPVFCTLRPFWIRFLTLEDRDTRICRVHDNTCLKAGKLKNFKLFKFSCVDDLTKSVCCA